MAESLGLLSRLVPPPGHVPLRMLTIRNMQLSNDVG